MKSSLHWSVKSASLSRWLIMEFTSCNLGDGGGRMARLSILAIPVRTGGALETPPTGKGLGGPRGSGGSLLALPPHPMAIMSALSLSSLMLPRWRRDVTSSGGMAVPTFHVTTVILGMGVREGLLLGTTPYLQAPSHRALNGEASCG